MKKDIDSDYITIGVRVPCSLASSFDEFCNKQSLSRSVGFRLLLRWFLSGPSRSVRGKFGRYVRDYKSFQRI